ncbi:hypothetical protein T492DRAFT_1540 [Pavlovales sp. CCMP2436]|nr:hypothetical protein T492DRAFT_1540 [Pavlovales sp. CCMP2436]
MRCSAAAPSAAQSGTGKPTLAAAAAAATAVALGDNVSEEPWPFEVDPLDQCETPLLAYQHLAPVLHQLAKALGKAVRDLRIYDPYYCTGASADHLNACGFLSVHHAREDFYKKVATRNTPEFDVLVTNPPWSGDHIERCLKFCRASGKPWACLLPNFVYLNSQRDHYDAIMRTTYSAGAAAAEPLCVVPRVQYRYHERFLKSARDVRTRHFAFWCADLCAHAPAALPKTFWSAQPPPGVAPTLQAPDFKSDVEKEGSASEEEGAEESEPPDEEAAAGFAARLAEWQRGADTVRSVRHLPYHALDGRDPRKRTLAASRHKHRDATRAKRTRE